MTIQFDLPFPQFVNLKYHISTGTGGSGSFYTRLLLDDEEKKGYRHATGVTWYQTHTASDDIYLRAGRHFAKVEYRAIGGRTV